MLILFSSNISFAQTDKKKIESLIAYIESDEITMDDFNEIKNTCKEIERLSNKIGFEEGVFIANLYLAQVFRDFSPKKIEPYVSKLDKIYEKSKNSLPAEKMVEYLLVKGYTSGSSGDFTLELEYYLKADSLVRKRRLKEYEVIIDQHIANFYSVNEEHEKALAILKKIVKDGEASGPKDDYTHTLNKANLGVGFIQVNQYDSAIYYTQEAIRDGLGNFSNLHYQYLTISDAYLQLNELDSAKKYLQITESLYKENYVYSIDVVKFNLTYGLYYSKLKDYSSAASYYRLALKNADSLNYINGIQSANENLLISSFKEGNNTDLLDYFNAYRNARDTITNRANLKTEQQHLAQFETLKKNSEINRLKLLREIETERQLLIVSILVIILLVLLFLVYRYRSRQAKLKHKLQLGKLEKEKAEQLVHKLEKELKSKIDHLKENARIIDELKKVSKTEEDINEMIEIFGKSYINDTEWTKIILQFENIHQSFISELKKSVDNLSTNDIKLAILTKLNYQNNDMAEILNISIHGVKKAKQRLKHKLEENDMLNLLF